MSWFLPTFCGKYTNIYPAKFYLRSSPLYILVQNNICTSHSYNTVSCDRFTALSKASSPNFSIFSGSFLHLLILILIPSSRSFNNVLWKTILSKLWFIHVQQMLIIVPSQFNYDSITFSSDFYKRPIGSSKLNSLLNRSK